MDCMIQQDVLIIGSGGREHALAWKIAQSPAIGKLYVAPGNPGTASIASNIDLQATDKVGLVQFAKAHAIDLTIVGPDAILAIGMVDAFQAAGLRIFGPTMAAARIESSKAFSKGLMATQGIPTANYQTFTDFRLASNYVQSQKYPLVVKASGLALGKGVFICEDAGAAERALKDIMIDKIFGESGSEVVIEDYVMGQEISIHAFCDGKTAALFPPSQDHKQIHEGDMGPNTGGMGAFAPVPWIKPALMERALTAVVEPALAGLAALNTPFIGLLYPGLMIADESLNVLEFNSRFGDPESQVYMNLLESDLLEIFNACVDGTLAETKIRWSNKTAVCVVLASGGYPGEIKKGLVISGLPEASLSSDVVIFHSGTSFDGEQLVTAGGRVLCVTATGGDLAEAREKAYGAVRLINFEGMQFRADIGNKSLS
jgi:phosphoribosylamine--glycine ligase